MMVIGRVAEEPPPGEGLLTLRLNAPAFASVDAGIVACNVELETNVVAN